MVKLSVSQKKAVMQKRWLIGRDISMPDWSENLPH